MKISASITDLARLMQGEIAAGEKAVTAAVKHAGC